MKKDLTEIPGYKGMLLVRCDEDHSALINRISKMIERASINETGCVVPSAARQRRLENETAFAKLLEVPLVLFPAPPTPRRRTGRRRKRR